MNNNLVNSRKISLLVIVATLTAALFSSTFIAPALAAPKLHGSPNCFIGQQFQLICEPNVSGLGTVEAATAVLTGTATVVSGCINRGSQDQQPEGLKTTNTGISASDTQTNIKQGRTTFHLESQEPTLRSCPDQMIPVLVCVQYTVQSIVVTTSSGSANILKGTVTVGEPCQTTRRG